MYGLFQGGTVLALLGDPDEAEVLARRSGLASHPCSSHGSRGAITPSASPRSTVATPQRRWSTSSVPTGATTPPAGGPRFQALPTGIEALIALGRLAEADARIADYERRCSPSATHAAWRAPPSAAG